MKKLILSAVLLLICTTVFAQEVTREEAEAILKQIEDSSVGIFAVGQTGTGFCSGVVLKNEKNGAIILTAKHCVGPYEEVYVENEKVFNTIVSNDDDLALLFTKTQIADKVEVKIAYANARWLEPVIDFGYPKAEKYISIGRVYVRTIDSQYAKLAVIPGCSGGGIFNLKGELVGILWGGMGESMAVFEPLSDVLKFIKEI